MIIKMGPVMGKKPAIVGTIEVNQGQRVEAGQVLVQVETGKGNRPVKAASTGTILEIMCSEGAEVKSGQPLFEFEEEMENEGQEAALETDLFILGGGPGGYVAALYAAKLGMKVVLAEKNLIGGTCLNRGCVPTKTFIQSAHLYQQIKKAAAFGVLCRDAAVDFETVFNRKEQICAELRNGVEMLLQSSNVTVLHGEAALSGADQAIVKDGIKEWKVAFRDAIVATGSKSAVLPFEKGLPEGLVKDSEQALAEKRIPKSVVIVGGGVIGMEFAFYYRNMDADVYVVEFTDQLCGTMDADTAKVIMDAAEKAGIHCYLNSRVTSVTESVSGQVIAAFEKDGKPHLIAADSVLSATGRKPVTEGIGLESLGIRLTDRGFIDVDEGMRTSLAHVYAIGDVTGKCMLAHAASRQGIRAVNAIRQIQNGEEDVIPGVIFTSPEVAYAGKTERECAAAGIAVKVSRFPFSANGKAKVMGEAEGFVKLICSAETMELLGGAIAGPDASSLISTIALAVKNRMKAQELSELVFAHPTTSEAIQEAAFGLTIGSLHYREA